MSGFLEILVDDSINLPARISEKPCHFGKVTRTIRASHLADSPERLTGAIRVKRLISGTSTGFSPSRLWDLN
jgi:hypothetical protein